MTVPLAQLTDSHQSLRELWQETLERVDISDPRLSVRPHEIRRASVEVTPGRTRTNSRGPVTHAPSSGMQEPGLEDLDNMRSGQDRFILGEMLGRGGMSVVLHALQRSLGRGVAVKVARYDLDQRQRERFRAESKLTAWLEHPNITPVYEAGWNYLVMRRIAGSDLEHQLTAGQLGIPQCIEVLIKTCDAVSFAHHRGIIHRDIKPENILVGHFGEVMLIDWGLALTWSRPADGQLRAPEIGRDAVLCAGTPGYMAPEMALAKESAIGPSTDVFLLGATLYRCLAGDLPFAGTDVWDALERSARNDWTPLAAGSAPRRLISLQERAMAAAPADRPTLAAFQTELREWLMRSRSEAEAQQALDGARGQLETARGNRLRPHESYHDFAACIANCDRALALNPDLTAAAELRGEALADFALAAVGAGELQLARLIKDSGRLPVLPRPAQVKTGHVEHDTATIRRVGALMPRGDATQAVALRHILQEMLGLQRAHDLLESEKAGLLNGYETVSRERDAMADAAERHQRYSRRWRGVLIILVVLTLIVLAIR